MKSSDQHCESSRRQWFAQSLAGGLTALSASNFGSELGSSRACADQAVEAIGNSSDPSADDAKSCPTHEDCFAILRQGRKIPVIFDTDIGSDIDDTWALLYLLKCPELDIRLVSTDAGQGPYRARLTAKFLTSCNRDDIPISVTDGSPDSLGNQRDWMQDYSLDDYRGKVHGDSVSAIIDTIHQSKDPVTLVCVGAVPNIAAALQRDPSICSKARFVGMHGAIHVGYGGRPPAVPEANVRSNPAALRKVLAAPWQCSITPLDTCGIVHLQDQRYQAIRDSNAIGVKTLMENYRDWLTRVSWLKIKPDPSLKSTTLFDLVAVSMAFSEQWLNMKELPIGIDEKGLTYVDDQSPPVRCAISWKDREGYLDHVTERLTAMPG